MSPDNGRPLHHLTQPTSQHLIEENIEQLKPNLQQQQIRK
jgi:hypothetical protein